MGAADVPQTTTFENINSGLLDLFGTIYDSCRSESQKKKKLPGSLQERRSKSCRHCLRYMFNTAFRPLPPLIYGLYSRFRAIPSTFFFNLSFLLIKVEAFVSVY